MCTSCIGVYETGTLASKQLFYMVQLDSASINNTHNIPNFFVCQSFWTSFEINVKV